MGILKSLSGISLKWASLAFSVIILSATAYAQEIESKSTLFRLEVLGTPGLSSGDIVADREENRDINGVLTAALRINTDLTDLTFSANNGILKSQNEPGSYLLYLSPNERVVTIYKDGFAPFQLILSEYKIDLESGQVWEIQITGEDGTSRTGVLLLRTVPANAKITIEGVPGEFYSPYTFTNISAKTHRITVELEDYKTETFLYRVLPGQPNVKDLDLEENFGFLDIDLINAPDSVLKSAELYLKTEGTDEFRFPGDLTKDVKVRLGSYSYRLEHNYYRSVQGNFSVDSNGKVRIKPELEPSFSTLRVSSNADEIKILSMDNRAPNSRSSDIIYLERGIRKVKVSSKGYVTKELNINSIPGNVIDTTITLITVQEMERRQQAPGIVSLKSDVPAKIYLDERLVSENDTVLSLMPGKYSARFVHPAGEEKISFELEPADFLEKRVVLLPSKTKAIQRSVFVPGGGQLYTKQKFRGTVYLAAFLGASAFAIKSYSDKTNFRQSYNQAYNNYQSANTLNDATEYRNLSESLYTDMNRAHDQLMVGLYVASTIYIAQLLDILLFKPEFGYQGKNNFSTGLSISGVSLKINLN